MESKYEKLFKIQLGNLVDDLILVFPNDNFILKIKTDLPFYLKDNNFVKKLDNYFNSELEEKIKKKDIENILGINQFLLPTSRENIIKLKIQNYWFSLNEKNKDKLWLYFNTLFEIYKKISF